MGQKVTKSRMQNTMQNSLEHKHKKKKFDDESWEDVKDKQDKKKRKKDDYENQRKQKRNED